MLKLLLKFFPLIIHEGFDLLAKHLENRQQKKQNDLIEKNYDQIINPKKPTNEQN